MTDIRKSDAQLDADPVQLLRDVLDCLDESSREDLAYFGLKRHSVIIERIRAYLEAA